MQNTLEKLSITFEKEARPLSQRDPIVDIAKGLGIILVIFSHLTQSDQWQRTLVFSFHMPLFFFLSGYVYKKKPLKILLKKGLKNYVAVAYAFLLLDICLSLGANWIKHVPFPTGEEWLKTITFTGGLWRNIPLWFLLTLLLCELLYNILDLSGKGARNGLAMAGCFLVLCIFGVPSVLKSNWILSLLPAYPFFYLGTKIKSAQVSAGGGQLCAAGSSLVGISV